MKIKKGDNVIIISGSRSDKGKSGPVLEVLKDKEQVIVEGINIRKKITRDPQGNKKEVKVEFPIHVSNVQFFDPKLKKRTRIGYKVDEKGNKIRIAKASGTELH